MDSFVKLMFTSYTVEYKVRVFLLFVYLDNEVSCINLQFDKSLVKILDFLLVYKNQFYPKSYSFAILCRKFVLRAYKSLSQ